MPRLQRLALSRGSIHTNVPQVALAQARSEKALERLANRILICDTDPLTTLIWSEFLFGGHPEMLDDLVRASRYDMTFLFDAATPWIPAPHRAIVENGGNDDVRCAFLESCEFWLKHFDREYTIVGGSYDERFDTCVEQCEQLLK